MFEARNRRGDYNLQPGATPDSIPRSELLQSGEAQVVIASRTASLPVTGSSRIYPAKTGSSSLSRKTEAREETKMLSPGSKELNRSGKEAGKTDLEKSKPGSLILRCASSQSTLKPVSDTVKPVSDTVKPVSDTVKPVSGTVKPVSDTVKPVSDTVKPVSDTVKPVSDTVKPVSDTVKPVSDTVKPVSDTVKPVSDTVKPVSDTVKPVSGSDERNVDDARTEEINSTWNIGKDFGYNGHTQIVGQQPDNSGQLRAIETRLLNGQEEEDKKGYHEINYDVQSYDIQDSSALSNCPTDHSIGFSSDHEDDRITECSDSTDIQFAGHSFERRSYESTQTSGYFTDFSSDYNHRQNIDDHSTVQKTDQSETASIVYITDQFIVDPAVRTSGQSGGHSIKYPSGHSLDESVGHTDDVKDYESSLAHLQLGNSSRGDWAGEEGEASPVPVVISFEATATDSADEAEHPYFVRLAAEAEDPTPILSRSGTIRGVKDRVRAGIAALLEKQDGKKKKVNQSALEKGKIIFYTTSVTVVRETSDNCLKVKKILQTQMVEYEERDIFMSKVTHQELTDRLSKDAEVPQVFADGFHLGGAEEIEKLNESGTLRKILSNFKKVQRPVCCIQCGGYRYIPCTLCHGSKKSTRNFFTNEFRALRCTACDDNGLVKCEKCNNSNDDNGPVMASTHC